MAQLVRGPVEIHDDVDIVSGKVPGGANTSHTIALAHLTSLLAGVPASATRRDYEDAAVHQNLLGRTTFEGRRRTFRYLRELYLLDPQRILFRSLRDLWDEDPRSRPHLGGLSALARDSAFRATADQVLSAPPGAIVTADDLAGAVQDAFPSAYNASSAAKIGRNTASSWTQTGHLAGRTRKTRQPIVPTPVSATFAVLLGFLQGARGQALFDTLWTRFLDATPREIEHLASEASQRGYLELRSAGGVVEVSFRHLLRPLEGESA